jgi:hypothetical protein
MYRLNEIIRVWAMTSEFSLSLSWPFLDTKERPIEGSEKRLSTNQKDSFLKKLPILEIVSTDIIFPLLYMCTQYCTIFTFHYFPVFSPLPTVPTAPDKTCSALLFSNFV